MTLQIARFFSARSLRSVSFWRTGGVLAVALACSGGGTAPDVEQTPGVGGGFRLGGAGELDGNSGSSTEGGDPSFNTCAGVVSQGEQVSLDMFVMLDHTGSMGNDCPLNLDRPVGRNGSKWCYATHAFGKYFTSPASTGNRVALQFMSGEDFVCRGGPNNGAAQAAVPMTLLPVRDNHPLITTLDQDDPVGGLGTQIEAALHGIADYTSNNETPGRSMIGVLVTDGDASGCEENTEELARIVADHLQRTGLRTFIIGMTGASLNSLEQLARAGGAPEHGPEFCGGQNDCHFWSVGNGDPEAFASALAQIESAAAIPCSYGIPSPTDGALLDPGLVNVQFQPAGAPVEVFSRVEACDGNGGWYYDDPIAPALLRLCPTTCERVTEEGANAIVDIAYGCRSVLR